MTIIIQALRNIALGEFMPSQWLTDPIKEKLNISSKDGEIEKENILSSMGPILIVLLFMSLAMIIILLLVRACKWNSKVQNLGLKLKKKFFWNSMIRTIITGYLNLSITSLATVSALDFGNSGETINSIISLLIFISLCQYPLSFGYLLQRKRKVLPL